jgi:hypothetical protein
MKYTFKIVFLRINLPQFSNKISKPPGMTQKKILVPSKNAESWQDLLADPIKHWQDGYSAKLTAYSWEENDNIPKEILNVLTCYPDFKDLELLIAIPEFKVKLPGGTRPSQNDVLAILSNSKALSVMTVEGKALEDFDELIVNWKKQTSQHGINERLGYLLEKNGIRDENINNLRYQLFHRLASAIIMAEKFHAKNAIMIVQSFIYDDNKNHFNDFKNFLKLYTDSPIQKSLLYKLTQLNGIDIFAAWIYSKPQNG